MVEIRIEGDEIIVKGEKGELRRRFPSLFLDIKIDGENVTITPKKKGRKYKALVNTFYSHIENMKKGVTEGFERKMKIFYSHFPMNIQVSGNRLIINNYLGERVPRVVEIPEGINVEVKKDELIIKGIDIEKIGNFMGKVRNKTKVRNLDRRVYQDGIYPVKEE